MFDAGLVEETRGLVDLGLREGRTASRAVGYAQALAVIDGTIDAPRMPWPTPRCAPGGWCAARSRGSAPTRGSPGSTRTDPDAVDDGCVERVGRAAWRVADRDNGRHG